ncbi:Ribulose-phosphate 3-epimerase Rpe [Helicobacter trogontum]|uniref:Ribulose-phosphate 3-epimerase n=1 Tax=Helicobacter trogontum TaxID=50960 RepID=A0ABQ0D1Z6_9HELI
MLDPKFEKLLHSLKQARDIDDLAKISMKNIDSENYSEPQFANNTQSIATSLIQVAPSLLSANFLYLAQEIESVVNGGCDLLHIDVMDGHFVPNMTLGPCVLEKIKDMGEIPLDIHFMVENADFFIDLYAHLTPKYMSIHIESERHLHRLIQKIRSYGISPAIAINPHTSLDGLKYILADIDMVLIMSVNPGFGGQQFIPNTIEKIADLKDMILMRNPQCLIEVDGGINDTNIHTLKNVGVDIAVAGNYIFKQKDRKLAIQSLKI